MGRLTVNGLDALSDDFAALARLPDSVIEGMLNAEADIIVAEQQRQVGTQWQGQYSEKISAESIKKGKVKKTKDGYYITISPQGTRKRGDPSPSIPRGSASAADRPSGTPRSRSSTSTGPQGGT